MHLFMESMDTAPDAISEAALDKFSAFRQYILDIFEQSGKAL